MSSEIINFNVLPDDLLLIMEYCHNGSLHNYLIRNRLDFISQVDGFGDYILKKRLIYRNYTDTDDPIFNDECALPFF